MKDYSPNLKAAVLETVENQLRAGDPPETRETLDRLTREGHSEEDARTLLGQVVAVEIYCILKEKKPFNQARFVRNLRNLPAEPVEQEQ
jgi:hypothetical protein